MSKSEVLAKLRALILDALEEKGWGRGKLASEVQKAGGGNVHEVFISEMLRGELPRRRSGGFQSAGKDPRYLKIGELLGIQGELIPLAEALQFKPSVKANRKFGPSHTALYKVNVTRREDGLTSVTFLLEETYLANGVSLSFSGLKISITRDD